MEIQKIVIDDYSFYLEDYGDNKGKVIVTGWDSDENYSYYWSAMGMDLKSFLKNINTSYFVGKMMPRDSQEIFSAKSTGKNIRKIWKEEIMPWYKNLEFQKDFREKLNSFLDNIISENHFVYEFDSFASSLDYYLIDDNFERQHVQDQVKDVLCSECWHLIEKEISPMYKKLSNSFTKLKNKL